MYSLYFLLVGVSCFGGRFEGIVSLLMQIAKTKERGSAHPRELCKGGNPSCEPYDILICLHTRERARQRCRIVEPQWSIGAGYRSACRDSIDV